MKLELILSPTLDLPRDAKNVFPKEEEVTFFMHNKDVARHFEHIPRLQTGEGQLLEDTVLWLELPMDGESRLENRYYKILVKEEASYHEVIKGLLQIRDKLLLDPCEKR